MPDVTLPDGRTWRVTKLFHEAKTNAKLRKNKDCLTLGLSMSPWKVNGLGNVCAAATPGCISNCLHFSGRAQVTGQTQDTIFGGRLARRVLYHEQPDTFEKMWRAEIEAGIRKSRRLGVLLAVRPNVFSDVDWPATSPRLIADYPEVVFYTYSKLVVAAERHLRGESPNYHVTFSRSERNESDCVRLLAAGLNVAVVFDVRYNSAGHMYPLPPTWNGFTVLDGDVSDERFRDPVDVPGYVIGLRAKGKARVGLGLASGFVVAADAATYASANI